MHRLVIYVRCGIVAAAIVLGMLVWASTEILPAFTPPAARMVTR